MTSLAIQVRTRFLKSLYMHKTSIVIRDYILKHYKEKTRSLLLSARGDANKHYAILKQTL